MDLKLPELVRVPFVSIIPKKDIYANNTPVTNSWQSYIYTYLPDDIQQDSSELKLTHKYLYCNEQKGVI